RSRGPRRRRHGPRDRGRGSGPHARARGVRPEAASGLTTRGRVALGVAVAVYGVGWAFGMQEATPIALGLALACLGGLAWVRRGGYRLAGATLLVEDPFGLVRRVLPLGREDALSVYPRLVELGGLFSEGGVPGGAGRRLLLSRVSGYDVHGVRDHQPGESLR